MAAAGLTLILQSKAIDRVHYAFTLAVSNAALGRPTTIFFATEGVEALRPDAWIDLSTAAGEKGQAFLDRLEAAKVADPDTLLDALQELDVRLAACDSALAIAGLTHADLRDDCPLEVTGLADILTSAGDNRLLYI